ncbi:MAG: helix-turn-helix domain-containing protein [Holosporaceae bacterium]|jgi:transcriptional regulator with XRE-family HTH domain|nr:helix-turn-helix domain-containing protein [Holosporaceae bacterium]
MFDYMILQSKSDDKNLDAYIGKRVKLRRTALGMSQEKLGAHLGVTFQQVQKYEKGVNRISASALYRIGCLLNVDMLYFVSGFDDNRLNDGSFPKYDDGSFSNKETSDLMRAFNKISNPNTRKKVIELIKAASLVAK